MTTVDDIFTYVNNIKNKMDSIRDIFNTLRDQVSTNTQLISEMKLDQAKQEFIMRNVGTKLEVEIDEPEPEPEPEEPIF